MDVKPNQFIKVFAYNGRVVDVFKSPTTGRVAIEIIYAKDIARSNPAELQILDQFEASTAQEFREEMLKIHAGQAGRLEEILA